MNYFTKFYFPLVLLWIHLFIENTDGGVLNLKDYCQAYGVGGKASSQLTPTLEECNMQCEKEVMPPCQKAIHFGAFQCCVYYQRKETYDFACLVLRIFPKLYVAGCDDSILPVPLITQRITPRMMKTTPRVTTTTTTTTTPAPADDGDATTTADIDYPDPGADEILPPLDPERCEDIVVTQTSPAWSNLQAKLQNESAHYFCHKLCKGPLPPKFPWLKRDKDASPSTIICKEWSTYDSSLCGAFLTRIMRRWNEYEDGTLTLTLCSHAPLPADVTTESSVTGDTVTGVTDGNVTDSTGSDVTGAVEATTFAL